MPLYGANTHRLVWSGDELPTTKPNKLCIDIIIPRKAEYFKYFTLCLHQVNHFVKTFDVLFRNYLNGFVINNVHLCLTFLSDRSKYLMYFTNLNFSKIIQCSYMMVTNWSVCWCVVSVYASHQCCLGIATKNFSVLHGSSWFLFLLGIPLSPLACQIAHIFNMCARQTRKK